MKQKFILGLGFLFTLACNNANKNLDYTTLYKNSVAISDYHTAIVAAQCILQADSSEKNYLDSLPELYAAIGNYTSAEHYVDIALVNRPNDEKLMQLKALCLQGSGKGKELLDFYNKLYVATNKINYLYQIAAMQFSAGNGEEAVGLVKTLEEKMVNSTDSVDIMVSETEKQKVPIRAAVYNMKAFMVGQKDPMAAKKFFEMALKEFPDFYLAQQNYMQLMNNLQGRR
jgi:tetratricopeptide (TPR) repeat protein